MTAATLNAAELVQAALLAAERLQTGADFNLAGLFSKEDWTSWSKGTWIAAGPAFKAAVVSRSVAESLGANVKNHQRYRRTQAMQPGPPDR